MNHDALIDAQGRLADQKLHAAGLTLTQGGEPTFVPHDTSAPEWNIAALGPEKLRYARRLARELVAGPFKGGVILQSFGKQYPGEPLPRWQIGIYRSLSGEALWSDVSRLHLGEAGVVASDPAMPRALMARLAAALGVPDTALPAYENFEARLRSDDSDEARRLLPRFSRKQRAFVSHELSDTARQSWLDYLQAAGWVLPLGHDGERWITDHWQLPDDDDLVLIPGDSPIGLRLPLGQLPEGSLRRGLTAELRGDDLLVFLPPLPGFAQFAELLRTIEKLVTELDLPPIYLEGYAPPGDPDLEFIGLTSDPGVLEVNLPPAASWPEFDRYLRGVFDCAQAAQMRSFKYQISGRKIGSGGGAHIVLGGPDLDNNPFIKKPTLLSSFLRFLQNHPSLSYAFSGLFIGPSSQAPRVDESAFELPYELEISLQALEVMPEPGNAWEIDAILRNLLMDWNGNTHRAELSVDKFFNANVPGGQKGLIEFRAFEMLPDVSMLLAENVLLRALAACFAQRAYREPLIDWREALHDRFALPCFLRQDLQAVIGYLNAQGFSFPLHVFDPQLDFRFPQVTAFTTNEVQWTLRQALEPWPVMGEHEGTGRVVDSTTDRLELSVRGLTDTSRLAASVNGLRVPLMDTGQGELAAGIRYRLFDNPWGLQPHIKAHSPLALRIIDAHTNKVVYAVDYSSWKLGGGSYDQLPGSEDEARRRVAERVTVRAELIGSIASVEELPASPRAPFTLDLRRSRPGT